MTPDLATLKALCNDEETNIATAARRARQCERRRWEKAIKMSAGGLITSPVASAMIARGRAKP